MQGAQIQAADWLAQYSDEPEKVREFCVRHSVLDHLRTTVELAKRNFPPIKELIVRLWKDPLEGTEKARISVVVRAGFEETRAGFWRFLGEWTQAVPFPEGDRIGFTYTSD